MFVEVMQSPRVPFRHANLEALHLSALSSDGGTALYLQGAVVGSAAVRFRRQYGEDAFRLVVAENMALQAFFMSRWKIEGDREKFADAWRVWVEEQFPVRGMVHLPQPPSVPPVRPATPAGIVVKAVPRAASKPPSKKGLTQQYGSYSNIRVVLRHFRGSWPQNSVGRRSSTCAPGLSWSRRAIAHGGPANT